MLLYEKHPLLTCMVLSKLGHICQLILPIFQAHYLINVVEIFLPYGVARAFITARQS